MVDVNCNRRNSKLMHLFKQVNINAMSLMIHRVLLILLTTSISQKHTDVFQATSSQVSLCDFFWMEGLVVMLLLF